MMFGVGGRRRGGGGTTVRSRARDWMVRNMRRAKRDAVCAWVKDDEVSGRIRPLSLYALLDSPSSRT